MSALVQQHGASRFQLLRKRGDGLARLGHVGAMGLGFLGGAVDLGRALADRNDEVRRGGRVLRHLAGGLVLLCHRAVDVLEHRPDRLDRLRDAVHGVDRAGGVPLQRFDLPGDFLGGALGLHRERLDLGCDNGKALACRAGARGLDGGIERQERGLPCDLREQVNDVADRSGGFP
jgi:hypothetical protein